MEQEPVFYHPYATQTIRSQEYKCYLCGDKITLSNSYETLGGVLVCKDCSWEEWQG